MNVSATSWLSQKASVHLHRGCSDLSDPEIRRQAALHNATGDLGWVFAMVFGVMNLASGHYIVALGVFSFALSASIALLQFHRTKNRHVGGWLAISVAGGLFLWTLATGGVDSTGHLWLPILPLFATFILGWRRGGLLTGIYIACATVILFVPGLPGVAVAYPTTLAVRLIVTTTLTGIIALYFEWSRQAAQARLRGEIEVRRRAQAEVLRAFEAKSALLAAVSHEVRTPLTAIMGLQDLLLQTGLDEEQRSYLDLAARSARSLVAVMNDLLDLSRVESGKVRIEAVPFDLYEQARALVDVQEVLVAGRELTVSLEWDETAPRQVVGDPARVRQVISNLLGNAVKFTPRGSVVVRVTRVAGTEETVTLEVSVEDTGVGLSVEQQARIFDAFIQTEPTQGGSGLGLAIAKNLVETMGGEIGVHSELGLGSIFWFQMEMPLAQEVARERAVAAGEPMFDARVLLVEDNDLNRDVLRMMLERMGCSVDTAANGAEGVDAFCRGPYDLVLMDCQMPVLDGYSAAARIRDREEEHDRTPIVAITAYALAEDLRRCLEAGMDDHISKPLLLEDVVTMLGRWLPSESSSARAS
jgi:signal transduction histidine kinase/ActR/RegA family two-component response regulator